MAGWYTDPGDAGADRWWDGAAWTAATRSRPPPAGTDGRRWLLWPLLTAAAGFGMVVGSFLPWTTLTGTFGEHASVAGTSHGGDGWLSVALGVTLVVAGLVSLPRPRRAATVLADLGALGAGVLMSYEFLHLADGTGVLGPSNSVGIWDVGAGVGLAVVTAAAVVSLLGAAGITERDARSVRPA